MVSNGPVPWYNRPARPFPARVWLEARYPFVVPRSALARLAAPPVEVAGGRPFPALVWLRWRGSLDQNRKE